MVLYYGLRITEHPGQNLSIYGDSRNFTILLFVGNLAILAGSGIYTFDPFNHLI